MEGKVLSTRLSSKKLTNWLTTGRGKQIIINCPGKDIKTI